MSRIAIAGAGPVRIKAALAVQRLDRATGWADARSTAVNGMPLVTLNRWYLEPQGGAAPAA